MHENFYGDIDKDNFEQTVAAIPSEMGITVHLMMRWNNVDIAMEIMRQGFEVPTVISNVYGAVGYPRITEFTSPITEHFEKALNRF